VLLALKLAPKTASPLDILCVGAHCDDIEIGCGGTVLAIQTRYPKSRVHCLVLTSTPARRKEAMAAAKSLIQATSRGELRICDLTDGLLPAHLPAVKAEFERMKTVVTPDLILTHHGSDRHQDHRLASEVTWQTFRNHLIWEYEIPKFDGDLVTPNMYIPLDSALAARKVSLIMRTFRSQREKSWFTVENLEAIMRLRGLECRSPSGLAEGFHCRKLTGEFSTPKPPGRGPGSRNSLGGLRDN
jgi:LmbE family N-acetylglucosaminyl deacetylase